MQWIYSAVSLLFGQGIISNVLQFSWLGFILVGKPTITISMAVAMNNLQHFHHRHHWHPLLHHYHHHHHHHHRRRRCQNHHFIVIIIITSIIISLQVVLDPYLHLNTLHHCHWRVDKPLAHFDPRACHNFPFNNWSAPLQRWSCGNYTVLHADRRQTKSVKSEDEEEEIWKSKTKKNGVLLHSAILMSLVLKCCEESPASCVKFASEYEQSAGKPGDGRFERGEAYQEKAGPMGRKPDRLAVTAVDCVDCLMMPLLLIRFAIVISESWQPFLLPAVLPGRLFFSLTCLSLGLLTMSLSLLLRSPLRKSHCYRGSGPQH